MSYTKLHSEILDSTIWLEDPFTKVVWITMLAMRDDRHEIQASIPGLARRSGVTIEQCEHALNKFLDVDPHSRSTDFEGRRIEKVRGGWRLLNGEYYQQRQSAEEKKAYNRIYMENKRLKEKLNNLDNVVNSSKSSKSNESSTVEKSRVEKSRVDNIQYCASGDARFNDFWKAYPKKRGKGACEKIWKRIKPNSDLITQMLNAIEIQIKSPQWLRDGGQFIPYPQKWLNEKRWEDIPETYQDHAFYKGADQHFKSKARVALALEMSNHRKGAHNEK